MIVKKTFLFAASITSLFIFIFIFICVINSNAVESNIKGYSKDEGVLSIMYHRFNETKYPSTNIQMDVFKEHVKLIKTSMKNFARSTLLIGSKNVLPSPIIGQTLNFLIK